MTPPASAAPASMAEIIADESSSPYNLWVGYQLIEWTPSTARFDLVLRPEHLNRTGVVHGGVLMAMLDATCSYSGLYPVEGVRRYCATIALNTQFIGSVSAGTLIATARRRGGGNSIFFASGEIHAADGTLLATAEATFRYRRSFAPPGAPSPTPTP